MSSASRGRAVATLIAVAGVPAITFTRPVRLGLELEGGTQNVLVAQDIERVKVDGDIASGSVGFILGIGMAVDANVVVFEAAKNEPAAEWSIRSVGVAGFRRAWSAIADSKGTTLLAAASPTHGGAVAPGSRFHLDRARTDYEEDADDEHT